jgi:cytochrome o ubiquinol oxidase operon protein cyoD
MSVVRKKRIITQAQQLDLAYRLSSTTENPQETATNHVTLSSYLAGFIVSLCLTMTAYLMVINHLFSRRLLVAAVAGLALAQFMTQLLFFLHLGRETKPRWKLGVFMFMVMVVLILVFGSIWIMANLNYHHDQLITPAQINHYMHSQDGL